MNEAKIIKEYENGKSSGELAQKYSTYPNKILRILKKNGIELRSKSEAQKNALKKGRSEHPTKGRTMPEETREKQSESQASRWKKMPKTKRERLKKGAQERWEERSEASKRAMLSKAGAALQKASREGSKAEKFLCEKLVESGYNVVPHKINLIPGKYELDIYLPDYNIVIEIDGPQHFLPIFGEAALQKHIQFDNEKNGLLLRHNITVIRVKYLVRHLSEKIKRNLWNVVYNALIKATKNKTKKGKLIEVEVNE